MTGTVQAGRLAPAGRPEVAAPLRAVEGWRAEPDGDRINLTAQVRVRRDDPSLRGHFPDLTVFPGVFIIETMCQAMAQAFAEPGTPPPVLAGIRSVRFLAPLLDGDELTLRLAVTPNADGGWSVRAEGCGRDGSRTARLRAEFRPGEAGHA